MKFPDALRRLRVSRTMLLEQVFRLIFEVSEVGILWEAFNRHDELPLVCPGPHLVGESQFAKSDCDEQVDFCPFRGPEAPFALRRS